MPENRLLLPPSFPRVCRNLPNILTHWVCALGVFGWLLSAYVGSPRYLVSLTCCFLTCCQGSRAFPALQETHPLASEPQGLLNHTTSSADFFFFCLLRWLTFQSDALWRQWCLLAFLVETSLVALVRSVSLGFVGFRWLFNIFRVQVQCLISEGLSTGKSLRF